MAKVKTEKNDRNSIKNIVFSIVILILIGLNLVVFINHNSEKKKADANTTSNEFNPKNIVREVANDNVVEQSMQNNISQMGERNRCQTYIGEFLTWIEKGDYNKAYNTLNSEFRANYFPSVEEFKTYVETHFPKNSALTYEDIDRQAPYYVVTVKMDDDSNSNFATLTERFVVRENGNNEFEISFQVQ